MNAPATLPARLPMPAEARAFGLEPHQWKVLAEAVFPAAKSPEAIVLALSYCKARKLDIFKRPVHVVPMWNKELGREVETIWPGVNELQVTAARTGKWAGMDPPRFGPDQTLTFEGKTKSGSVSATVTFPEWCEVTVYRLIDGQRCAFTETVYWLETYSRIGRTDVPNEMWQRRSRSQLAKCAKASSLRAAFPEEGEYVAEEMEGKEYAGGVTIDARAEEVAEPLRRTATDWWDGASLEIPPNGGGWQRWCGRMTNAINAAPDVRRLYVLMDDNKLHTEALAAENKRAAETLRALFGAREADLAGDGDDAETAELAADADPAEAAA
jgi:phage recombination protein Bet